MRKIVTFLVVVLFSATLCAQSPEKMSYQAVVRNNSEELVTNQTVGMQISILQGSAAGTPVYVETQTPTSNANGLVSIEIGAGTTTDVFSTIDWAAGSYFIKTETDPTGGTNYTIVGVSQLLSVPYALYAKTSGSIGDKGATGDQGPVGEKGMTGDKGATGDQGPAGEKGMTGDKGAIGDQGPVGEKGLTGDKGPIGDKGEAGDPAVLFDDTQTLTNKTWTSNKIATELSGKADASHIHNVATASAAGFMSSSDKTKLDGVAAGAEVNENADWNAISGDAQILNKPTLFSGSYNNLTDKPANIDEDKTNDVTTTGNQTIAGNKTFTGTTTVSSPVNATDAATKAYVDELKDLILDLQAEVGVTDSRDGYHYKAVRIGNTIWMAENLRYLPSVNMGADGSEDAAGSYYYVFGYNGTDVNEAKATANYATYGVLYNWTAAVNGSAGSITSPSGVQGACPKGWHVPSDLEWGQLLNELIASGYNYDGTVSGNKIAKAMASASGWTSSLGEGVVGNSDYPEKQNASGFTALPAGVRFSSGMFYYIGSEGSWWSASAGAGTNAWYRQMNNNKNSLETYTRNQEIGYPVRCVKD